MSRLPDADSLAAWLRLSAMRRHSYLASEQRPVALRQLQGPSLRYSGHLAEQVPDPSARLDSGHVAGLHSEDRTERCRLATRCRVVERRARLSKGAVAVLGYSYGFRHL